MLIKSYSERFIPIIPEKDLMGKFSPQVIAYRKRTLNEFLKKLVSDPTWVDDPNVEKFLKYSEQGFESPLEKSEGLFSSLYNKVTNLANDTVSIPDDGSEEWFEAKMKYIRDLGDNFKNNKLIRDSIIEYEKEKIQSNHLLAQNFVKDDFLRLLKDKRENQMFQEYFMCVDSLQKIHTEHHNNAYHFQDFLNNQHLLCLEEIRLLEKKAQ